MHDWCYYRPIHGSTVTTETDRKMIKLTDKPLNLAYWHTHIREIWSPGGRRQRLK